MRRLLPFLAAALAFATPAFGQGNDYEREQQETYAHCMSLTESEADTAFDMAQTWLKTGGGLPAQHCAAIALVKLKKYAEAGEAFEAMIPKAPADNPELTANIYAQGGNAWLLANFALRAHELFTAGLKLVPPGSSEHVELLIDRARALTMAEDDKGAIADLEAAARLLPERPDILALQASSHRRLRQFEAAQDALARALALAPDHPEALLERGNLRITLGDEAGARADWVRFLALYGESPEAEAVRRNLERLDVKVEDFTADKN
ncbi:MAG TPA: tetratricopeptide repeat protein [Sphingomonadales bacterium]|nr:tetratricopeptide repeat protein [Sphingomonadales bacterium]